METRVCSYCQQLKPADGFQGRRCADCVKVYFAEYYRRNAERKKAMAREYDQRQKAKKAEINPAATKVCAYCGEEKPLIGFNGRRCADCRSKVSAERWQRKKDQIRESHRRWRAANAQPGSPYRLRQQANEKRRTEARRQAMFAAYGGARCACCGETEPMFLTVDHINGGGRQHMIEIGRTDMVDWLFKNNYPPGFRILCYNCNAGRYRNGGRCPHEILSDSPDD